MWLFNFLVLRGGELGPAPVCDSCEYLHMSGILLSIGFSSVPVARHEQYHEGVKGGSMKVFQFYCNSNIFVLDTICKGSNPCLFFTAIRGSIRETIQQQHIQKEITYFFS